MLELGRRKASRSRMPPSSGGGTNGYVVSDSATARRTVGGERPFDKFAELAAGFP